MAAYFVIAMLGGMICAVLAGGKGRNVLGWFVIGFLLPLIGVILVVVLPEEGTAPPTHHEPKRTTSTYLDDLQKLADLRERGILTEQEFEDKKRLVMASAPTPRAPTTSTAEPATSIPEIHQAEAKAMLGAAQKRHFAKEFGDAKRLYEDIVSRFPSTKQAAVARQQLINLKDI